MKNSTIHFMIMLLIILSFQAITPLSWAQSPQKLSYQAVIRNSSSQLVVNKSVGMRVSILKGSESGVAVYTETQKPTTNANGLATVEIGAGTTSDNFSAIDWSNGKYYIKTETDVSGGTNYSISGASQLLSVPYALYAAKVENDKVNDADADPANEIQVLSKSGNTVTLTKGGGSVSVDDADADSTNEIQTLSINGNSLSLSKNGGIVNIPSGADNWGTQTTTTDATLSGNGTMATPLKIAQQAAILGQVLKWNGTIWLPGEVEASSGGGFAPGDSLVLKDNRGVTRMVLNPNTGTFKMMNNDTVWYSINVNSPPCDKRKNEDGSITETSSDGNYSTYFQRGEDKYYTEQGTKTTNETFNNGETKTTTTTTTSKLNNNQVSEKTTEKEERETNGSLTTRTTERFDTNGKKISETIVEHAYGLLGDVNRTEIINRVFDSSGNIISESNQVKDLGRSFDKFAYNNNNGAFSTQTNSTGLTLQGGATNTFAITPTQNGNSFKLGLIDGTPYAPWLNFISDPIHGGWLQFNGKSLGFNAQETFTTGNLVVGGTLNVNGTKNFRIDHPNDPKNKYLVHASIESNEVLNKYSGNIITDINGESIVTLPDYFTAINIDFRYQLTVIGVFAQAIVFREIENNQFIIKTDKPNVKVSWEVTARRNDQFIKENPFKAVVEK